MEQVIITGSGAATTIGAITGLGTEIRSIEIDIPLNEVGISDPAVTLSGSLTGAYTFHSDTTLNLRYGTEVVNITTENFTTEYSAIIRYIRYGDQIGMLNTRNMDTIPLPTRLRIKT